MALVSGTQFDGAAPVLRLLALALLSSTLLAALGVQVMLPRGWSRQFSIATVAALLLQCLALVALVPAFGAPGAALALLLSEATVVAGLLWWLRRATGV